MGVGPITPTAAAASGYQPLDSDLTAIAALSTTTFGRSLLTAADAAAGRTSLSAAPLAALPAPIVKTADTSRNTTTTKTADPHLTHAIAANEEWFYDLTLFVGSASNTPDLRFAPSVPAGAYVVYGMNGLIVSSTGVQGTSRSAAYVGTNEETAAATSAGDVVLKMWMYVANGSTAGNVALTWAQFTSDGTDVTLRRGSTMLPRRVSPF